MPSRSASIVFRCSIHCWSISSSEKWRAKYMSHGRDSSFSRSASRFSITGQTCVATSSGVPGVELELGLELLLQRVLELVPVPLVVGDVGRQHAAR